MTTSPFVTATGILDSGRVAGPFSTAPVRPSKRDPWQGQSSWLPLGETVQPSWVQIALKQTAEFALGRATIAALPSGSCTDLHCPTGTADSAVSRRPAAWRVGWAGEPPPPEAQAASASTPAVPVPATRTERREGPDSGDFAGGSSAVTSAIYESHL